MSEYTKIETARSIICDMCECLYPDGYCPEKCDSEKCDWMEHLKEDAADVVPVRHGRWIEQEKYTFGVMYDCSICGDRILDNGHSWNYCPNCGARMDGGD